MNTTLKNIVLEGKHQKPILTDICYNATQKQQPVVIFCHGYKGFKDWGAWDLVAETFANAGFFFIKFNFSHNGGSVSQPIDFPDLEAFGQNNYSKELDDLGTVIDWVHTPGFPYAPHIDTSHISLIGHSRGGGIVTIKAAEDPRIKTLSTWAGVSDYKRRFPKGADLEQWEKDGVFYITNGRTQQQMPHYFQFYTSFLVEEERLTISRAAQKIQIPHLIVHGIEDTTVGVTEAKHMHQWNPKSHLLLIPDANHVFGAKHPWNEQSLPETLKMVVHHTLSFIKT